jgi:SAM-dependent methyltransferase
MGADEVRFRTDLYAGTAEDYDRYRPPYPAALIDDLRARVPLGPGSRVLDLACGTGQLAFTLAEHAREVVAVDQEPGFVDFCDRKAGRLGVTNVRTVLGAAEDVVLDGDFDLVAIGNAFHRLDREVVARRLVPHLRPAGCLALVWGDGPSRGDRAWQRVLDGTLADWTERAGARDRVPAGWDAVIARDPHEAVVRRVGLAYEGTFEFTARQRWSPATLAGFAYSTSFLSRAALGDHAAAFEADLRLRLLACRSDGVFEQDVSFAYQLARRQG